MVVVQLKIPGRSLAEARDNLHQLRRLFIQAAEGRADMFAILAWELEEKAALMRTRDVIRKRKRKP
jgi:hypothetical protein